GGPGVRQPGDPRPAAGFLAGFPAAGAPVPPRILVSPNRQGVLPPRPSVWSWGPVLRAWPASGDRLRMERREVVGGGGGRWPAAREDLIGSAIGGWRVSLVDFTAGNRLLDFRPGGTGVEVARPAAGDVLARLQAGGAFAFRSLTPRAGAAAAVPPP